MAQQESLRQGGNAKVASLHLPSMCDWRSPTSEQLFRELAELSPDWYWEQDETLRFSWVSPGYEKNAGRPPADVLGKTRWEAWNADLEDPFWRAHFETLQRREAFRDLDFSFPGSDGQPRWTRVSGVPKFDVQGRFLGYRGVGRAMTERKQAEQALRQSEERCRDFARASNDWMIESDAGGRFIWVGGSAPEGRRVPFDWYMGRRHTELASPGADFGAEPWASHLQTVERHEPFRDFRYVFRDPAGDVIVAASGVPYFDLDGRFLGYRDVARDITAQVQAEQAARTANDRLRAAIENLNETIALTDAEDRIILANRRFRELSGAPAKFLEPGVPYAEFLQSCVALGIYVDAVGREQEWLAERLARRRLPSGPFEQRLHDERWSLVNDQHLPDGGTITYGLDITDMKRVEEKRLEEARHQHDALVREVHHRIKNNLQGVVGLLKQHVHEHWELAPVLQRAVAQVQLVALVHGLQGQPTVGDVGVYDLVFAVTRNVETVTRTQIPIEMAVSKSGLQLSESESVAVALIVNELLFNAVKHTARDQNVRVLVRQLGTRAVVSVSNPGALTPGFDFAGGCGIGTGLELARALIPVRGMRVSFAQKGAEVCATIELQPPVVII